MKNPLTEDKSFKPLFDWLKAKTETNAEVLISCAWWLLAGLIIGYYVFSK